MYNIDLNKFKSVFPNCKDSEILVNLFDNILNPAGINTKERVCMFLAQCGHESGGFSVNIENLNYSATSLKAVFGKYFPTNLLAEQYARQPEKIANRVYANRMSNGDEASGDGWKFRGRGFIQITGKYNYQQFSKDFGLDIVENPDLVSEDIVLSIKTAVWFWNKNNLNVFADKEDLLTVTKRINGGTNGIEDRKRLFNLLNNK